MHEEQRPPSRESVEERRQRVEVEQLAACDADSGEPVERGSGREGDEAAAAVADDLADSLVERVEQVGRQAERRRAGEDGDVDPAAVEELEPPSGIVGREVGLELALGRLEPRTAQARRLAPALERADELLRPEVLVDVVGRQAGVKRRRARQVGLVSKSKYFVRSIVSSPPSSRRPGIVPLCSRTEWYQCGDVSTARSCASFSYQSGGTSEVEKRIRFPYVPGSSSRS
jgi:hypothetical protein